MMLVLTGIEVTIVAVVNVVVVVVVFVAAVVSVRYKNNCKIVYFMMF